MNRIDRTVFREAGSWAEDRERNQARSSRRAWFLVWLLAAVAVVEALALVALAPLKTVIPYTVLVDRQTGYVTTLDPSKPVALGADEALIRSLLVQYVAAREGFSLGSVRSDYRRVMSWSTGTARAGYARSMTANNPDGPFARYGRTSVVEVAPKSVSDLSSGSALVRFDVIRSEGEGRALAPAAYAAVVNYAFRPRGMSVEERFLNPLGFEVSRYRRDPEAAPAAVQPAPGSIPSATIQPLQRGPAER